MIAVQAIESLEPSDEATKTFSKQFRAEMKYDEFIAKTITELTLVKRSAKGEYISSENGLMYRHVHPKGSPKSILQLVVPAGLCREVLLQLYDSKFACHFGTALNLNLIQR